MPNEEKVVGVHIQCVCRNIRDATMQIADAAEGIGSREIP